MRFQFPVLAAILVSVFWAALCFLTFLPGTILPEPLVNPDLLAKFAVFAAPLLIIWSLALMMLFKDSSDNSLWNLQNQIQNSRSLLSSYNKQLGQLAGLNGIESQKAAADQADGQASEDPPPPPTDDPEEPPKQIQPLPVPRDTLIRAMNFAEDADDTEAFEALDAAAEDPEIDELLDLAMQMLQALAAAELAVDSLPVDFAQPVEWRKAFPGKGRRPLEFLGSVGNPPHHSAVRRMFECNPDLRAAADSFTDRALSLTGRLIFEASDRQILAFADTRTMRACILIHCSLASG